jgi:ADP-ribosyl-[dinitrogen reductase] hydrolase
MKGAASAAPITYEADAPGLAIGHCSCRTCRKAHAPPFGHTASVPPREVQVAERAGQAHGFESSPGKNRHFCSVCGSH